MAASGRKLATSALECSKVAKGLPSKVPAQNPASKQSPMVGYKELTPELLHHKGKTRIRVDKPGPLFDPTLKHSDKRKKRQEQLGFHTARGVERQSWVAEEAGAAESRVTQTGFAEIECPEYPKYPNHRQRSTKLSPVL